MRRRQWIEALSYAYKDYQWSWKVVAGSISTGLIEEKDTWINWSRMPAVRSQIDTNYKSDDEYTLQCPLRWWNELLSGYYLPISLQKRYRQLHFVHFDACAFFEDSTTFPVTLFRQRHFLQIDFQACPFSLILSFVDKETREISWKDVSKMDTNENQIIAERRINMIWANPLRAGCQGWMSFLVCCGS